MASTITLRQVQVFLAVARAENVGAAAESLSMSKSAVSQSLSELEARLGVQLFDRSRGRIFLTTEGRGLMPRADEMVRRADDITNLFRDSGRHGQFRMGCTRTIGTFMLADLLKEFQDATGTIPRAEIANTRVIAEKLSRFDLDIALIEGPVTDTNLIVTPWMTDEMVVVAPRDHPLTGRAVDYRELAGARWVLREKGSSTRDFFETQLGGRLVHVDVAAELNSFDAILRSVLAGIGLTYMSSRALDDPVYGRFVAPVRIPERFTRRFDFCYVREKYLSADVIAWMEHCRNHARRLERRREQPVFGGMPPLPALGLD